MILDEKPKIILQEFIHEDQCGFLPKRQLKDNVRTVLDILEYLEQLHEKQATLIFLDAEKAFDNLNWTKVLEDMNFGESFIKWVKSIYTLPMAQIIVNGD